MYSLRPLPRSTRLTVAPQGLPLIRWGERKVWLQLARSRLLRLLMRSSAVRPFHQMVPPTATASSGGAAGGGGVTGGTGGTGGVMGVVDAPPAA